MYEDIMEQIDEYLDDYFSEEDYEELNKPIG